MILPRAGAGATWMKCSSTWETTRRRRTDQSHVIIRLVGRRALHIRLPLQAMDRSADRQRRRSLESPGRGHRGKRPRTRSTGSGRRIPARAKCRSNLVWSGGPVDGMAAGIAAVCQSDAVSSTQYRRCEDCTDDRTCELRMVFREVRDSSAAILDGRSLANARRNANPPEGRSITNKGARRPAAKA